MRNQVGHHREALIGNVPSSKLAHNTSHFQQHVEAERLEHLKENKSKSETSGTSAS